MSEKRAPLSFQQAVALAVIHDAPGTHFSAIWRDREKFADSGLSENGIFIAIRKLVTLGYVTKGEKYRVVGNSGSKRTPLYITDEGKERLRAYLNALGSDL